MNRILSLPLLSLGLSTPAAAATWQIDTSHSRMGFKVKHMMISWVQGEFGDFSGTIDYDPAAPDQTRADVTIQVASIDTDEPKRDAHLVSPDFFDATTHPTLTFQSTKVRKVKGDDLELVGNLTMRGVTKEVVLQVSDLSAPVADAWGNLRVGASATTTLNRQDWGVSWNDTLDAGGVVVSDEVILMLDVEMSRPVQASAQR